MDSVERSGHGFSIIKGSWNLYQIRCTLTIQKLVPWISQVSRFFDFESGLREIKRWYNLKKSFKTWRDRFSIKNWSWKTCQLKDSMTSPPHAIRLKSQKSWNLRKSLHYLFSNCERTCYSTNAPASIYNRKTAVRPFDTINDIVRSLSLVESLAMRQFGASGNQLKWGCR